MSYGKKKTSSKEAGSKTKVTRKEGAEPGPSDIGERKFQRTVLHKVKEFVEIGGSPTPGISLRQVPRGHSSAINRIAWSPDGPYLASPSDDMTIQIWDIEHGKCISVLEGHSDSVISVAWSPDGKQIVSNRLDETCRVWNIHANEQTQLFWGFQRRSMRWSVYELYAFTEEEIRIVEGS